MKPSGVGQGANKGLPAVGLAFVLGVVSLWASYSTSLIQEYVLRNTFTLPTIIIIIAACILVCLFPGGGLLRICVVAYFSSIFLGLLYTWIQQDGQYLFLVALTIGTVLYVAANRYAPKIKVPRPPITLQGIPQIIFAGILSNLLFVGLAYLTFFSLLDLTLNNSDQNIRFLVFFIGYPFAGVVMGLVSALLARRGDGGVVAALISGIGWFIVAQTNFIPAFAWRSDDPFLDTVFRLFALIGMPLLGAFVMRATGGQSSGRSIAWTLSYFVIGLLIFACIMIPLGPIIWGILQLMFQSPK